jgi:hypothetical protein
VIAVLIVKTYNKNNKEKNLAIEILVNTEDLNSVLIDLFVYTEENNQTKRIWL